MLRENRWSWGRELYWGIILFVLFVFLNMFFYDETPTFKALANLILGIISLIVTLFALNGNKIINNRITLTKKTQILLLLIIICFIIIVFVEQLPKLIITAFQSKYLYLSFIFALSSALLEESICRGLFLSAFIGHGVIVNATHKLVRAAIYSSLLFGLLHIINLLTSSPQDTFLQIFYTFSMGIFLAAIRITTNNLFSTIIIHFLLDFAPYELISSNTSSSNTLLTLLMFTPLLVLSLIYIVKLERDIFFPNKDNK